MWGTSMESLLLAGNGRPVPKAKAKAKSKAKAKPLPPHIYESRGRFVASLVAWRAGWHGLWVRTQVSRISATLVEQSVSHAPL